MSGTYTTTNVCGICETNDPARGAIQYWPTKTSTFVHKDCYLKIEIPADELFELLATRFPESLEAQASGHETAIKTLRDHIGISIETYLDQNGKAALAVVFANHAYSAARSYTLNPGSS